MQSHANATTYLVADNMRQYITKKLLNCLLLNLIMSRFQIVNELQQYWACYTATRMNLYLKDTSL